MIRVVAHAGGNRSPELVVYCALCNTQYGAEIEASSGKLGVDTLGATPGIFGAFLPCASKQVDYPFATFVPVSDRLRWQSKNMQEQQAKKLHMGTADSHSGSRGAMVSGRWSVVSGQWSAKFGGRLPLFLMFVPKSARYSLHCFYALHS